MESNYTDREMRDKLESVEFPFDPKAWEQMETMLNERKKRRGFFWGWFSGIAACLLMAATIGYEAMKTNAPPPVSTAAHVESSSPVANTERRVSNQEVALASPVEQLPVNPKTNALSAKALDKAEETDRNERRLARTDKGLNVKPGNSNSTGKTRKRTLGIANNSNQLSLTTSSSASLIAGTGGTLKKLNVANQANATFASAAHTNSAPEEMATQVQSRVALPEIYLETMKGAELETSAENSKLVMERKDDDVTLPKTKKTFHYSIGAITNVTFATLGNQTNGQLSDPTTHTSLVTHPHVSGAPFFYQQASFGAGLTQEFMFGKRFAISNSLLLSQTSYRVFYTGDPYTAKATSLDIPVGLKVYPVSKNKFRFYIESGIINHFILTQSTIYPPAYYKLTSSGNNNGSQSSLTSESVSLHEYYASFYASSGVEFIVKKHFVLFTAPLFYMSLNKVAGLESHQYNLGLEGGFRYQF